MTEASARALRGLTEVLQQCAPASLAVSGGVDSMTLASVAARELGDAVVMLHAVSPAVPPAATARVERQAELEGWQLRLLDAGEFTDPRYLANPANRCFYCKQNLYAAIAASGARQILSGTNLDDLQDWRPGLAAAAAERVRHPFVEAGIDKAGVRAIARHLGLDAIAELPAAPCLSSRVETGIPIVAGALAFVDQAEALVRRTLAPATVRCRVRRQGVVIELDHAAHEALGEAERAGLRDQLRPLSQQHGLGADIAFAPYERGSAFLRDPA